ncbi:LOG family protein [Calditrichota bacterium]
MQQSEFSRGIPEVSVLTEPWFGILASRKRELIRNGGRMIVTVFGGSAAQQDSPVWKHSYRIGREVANHNGIIISGGYGGVMEAASQGAREAEGSAIGVTCHNLMGNEPNPYVDHIWDLDRWDQRLLALIWLSDAYVVMPGSSGTLVELSMAIETQNKGFIPKRKIVCFTRYWEAVVKRIEGSQDIVHFSRSTVETVKLVMS